MPEKKELVQVLNDETDAICKALSDVGYDAYIIKFQALSGGRAPELEIHALSNSKRVVN